MHQVHPDAMDSSSIFAKYLVPFGGSAVPQDKPDRQIVGGKGQAFLRRRARSFVGARDFLMLSDNFPLFHRSRFDGDGPHRRRRAPWLHLDHPGLSIVSSHRELARRNVAPNQTSRGSH